MTTCIKADCQNLKFKSYDYCVQCIVNSERCIDDEKWQDREKLVSIDGLDWMEAETLFAQQRFVEEDNYQLVTRLTRNLIEERSNVCDYREMYRYEDWEREMIRRLTLLEEENEALRCQQFAKST